VIERLRKKLSEQESLLLLMSPNMAFRVANRNGKVSHESLRRFLFIKFMLTDHFEYLALVAKELHSMVSAALCW